MSTQRIDDGAVEALQPGQTIWDAEARGFGVRCRARDRTYVVKTRAKGRQVLLTIGRHGTGAWTAAKARREAIRLLGIVRDGQDPARDRAAQKSAPSVAEFGQRFMAEYSRPRNKPKTIEENERILKLHVGPALGTKKVTDVGKADIAKLHAKLAPTPVLANRVLALLATMLTWAESIDERPEATNPCRHIDRYPEQSRERMLTAGELGRLGDALEAAATVWTDEKRDGWRQACERDAEALPVSQRATWIAGRLPKKDGAEDWRSIAVVRLLALTGARVSEVLNLPWDRIDFDRGTARLTESKTGKKNLYLPAGALAVLATLPRFEGNPHVVPGDRPGRAFVGIQKAWQRIRALAALSDVHLHDLRHSFASTAVAGGDSLYLVGKVLGHSQAGTTQKYAHVAADPALAVATRAAERVADLMQANRRPSTDNVVQHPAVKSR